MTLARDKPQPCRMCMAALRMHGMLTCVPCPASQVPKVKAAAKPKKAAVKKPKTPKPAAAKKVGAATYPCPACVLSWHGMCGRVQCCGAMHACCS